MCAEGESSAEAFGRGTQFVLFDTSWWDQDVPRLEAALLVAGHEERGHSVCIQVFDLSAGQS